MNYLKTLLLCFFFFGLGNFKAQDFDEKPKILNNFQSNFLKVLNSKYKNKEFNIDNDLKNKIKTFKAEYLYVLNEKYQIYSKKFPPQKGKPLYPDYGYVFVKYLNNYPDINAVFLNRGNLLSDEKISDEEKQKYNELFMEIAKKIPTETYIELSKLTDEIKKDKFALTVPYRFEVFQDLFDENARKRIEIINFLLWNLE